MSVSMEVASPEAPSTPLGKAFAPVNDPAVVGLGEASSSVAVKKGSDQADEATNVKTAPLNAPGVWSGSDDSTAGGSPAIAASTPSPIKPDTSGVTPVGSPGSLVSAGASGVSGSSSVADKVFVGGISWQAREADLTSFFANYGPVVEAKIIRDTTTGKSKGYGFVTFGDEATANQVKSVGFVELLGRKCQVGDAVRGIGRSASGSHLSSVSSAPPSPSRPSFRAHVPHPPFAGQGGQQLPPAAPAERRMFVGGLPRMADENALHFFFSQWGPVSEVKIIYDSKRVSKGYGFVTFHDAHSAAIVKSYGTVEFMGRQMNVGDAVRGMGGQLGRSRREQSPASGHTPPQVGPFDGPSFLHPQPYGMPLPGGYSLPGFTSFPPPYGAMEFPGAPQYGLPGYTQVPGFRGFASPFPPGMEYGAVPQPYELFHPGFLPVPQMPTPPMPNQTPVAAPVPIHEPSPAPVAQPVKMLVGVPASAVPTLEDGQHLKGIGSQSGCQLVLLPAVDNVTDRHIEITGVQGKVDLAQQLLQAFVMKPQQPQQLPVHLAVPPAAGVKVV